MLKKDTVTDKSQGHDIFKTGIIIRVEDVEEDEDEEEAADSTLEHSQPKQHPSKIKRRHRDPTEDSSTGRDAVSLHHKSSFDQSESNG